MPNIEKQWRARLIILKTLVPQKEKIVNDWQNTFGKEHSSLMTKLRKKHMGPLGLITSQALHANKAHFAYLHNELKVFQKD